MGAQQLPHRQAFARMFGLQTMADRCDVPGNRSAAGPLQEAAVCRVGGVPLHDIYHDLALGALRRGEPLSMGLLGFDGWQTVARLHGWGIVDRTMVEITRVLLRSFRSSDVLARWREDEIAVLLPGTDEKGAVRAAEKAVRSLDASGVLHFAEGWVQVGVSAGVAPIVLGAPFADAIDEATGQLHVARQAGPGRVRWHGGEVVAMGGRIATIDPAGRLEHCKEVFLRLGGEVTRESDAEACLQRGVAGLALVVLALDAGADGFGQLERLRADPLLHGCPIVVIGRHPDELPISFELGADDFLVHPVSTLELGARVRRLLGRRRMATLPTSESR